MLLRRLATLSCWFLHSCPCTILPLSINICHFRFLRNNFD
jgi:hypothetical protein